MSARPPYTCLWFDGDALAAAERYVRVVPGSRILSVDRAPTDNPSSQQGSVLVVTIELRGTRIMLLNGGPQFKQSEAASIVIECDTQAEVDGFSDGLIAGGGAQSDCGWLKDPWGVSWQITPTMLIDALSNPEPGVAQAVFWEMMTMQRLDLARLEAAAGRARSS